MDLKSDQTIYDALDIYDSSYHEEMIFAMDVLIIFMVISCLLLCKLPLCFITGTFIGKRKSKLNACSERNNQSLSPDQLV